MALLVTKLSKYYKSFGKNIVKFLHTFAMAFTCKFQFYPLRKQSICNLVTILSLCNNLECTHFVSRILKNYIDWMAAYLLGELISIIRSEKSAFLCFYMFYFFTVIFLYIMKITIWGILLSLVKKMANPWLNEFDVYINFIRIYVGIERDIVKTHFMKNIKYQPILLFIVLI